MRFIDAALIDACCSYPLLVEALRQGHRHEAALLDDRLLPVDSAADGPGYFVRTAWLPGQAIGTKLITLFWDNPAKTEGLPAVQAIYALFDGQNGRPLAILDGTGLTYKKTAADSALGSRFLARTGIDTMLMVGAGALACHLIEAHCAIRPSIRRILIWNRTLERAHALASALTPANGAEIEVALDLEQAVRMSSLISVATRSSEPLIQGAWLQRGTHLDLVGAYNTSMREADDETLRKGRLFVDSRATTLHHTGEICIPLASGVIVEADILAEHHDLAVGRHPGRQGDDEITVFKNGGGGHLDLMTARFILDQVSS